MEFFDGFNAEELAMMQELLRLLVEDDDVLTQTPQENQLLFSGISPEMNDINDFQWSLGAQNSMAWNVAPPVIPQTTRYPVNTSRTRTRSNFTSEDEPMLKRSRVNVSSTMLMPVNQIPYSYY